MRGRVILLVVLVVLGALVAALNWPAMNAPVVLDLLATTVVTTVGALLALVAGTLLVIFVLASLLDRSRQLHQLGTLERHLEDARAELDRKRSADLTTLTVELQDRLDTVASRLEGTLSRLQDRLEARVETAQDDLGDRIEAVRERVVVVRDELAADIAEVEDALLRRRVEVPDLAVELEPLDPDDDRGA